MGCFAWLNSRFAIPERDWVGFDMLVIVCVIVFVFVIAGCARLVTWWRAGTLCANLTTVSRECRDCICFTFVYMLIMSFGLALIWFHMYLQDQGYLTRRISVIAFLGMEAACVVITLFGCACLCQCLEVCASTRNQVAAELADDAAKMV